MTTATIMRATTTLSATRRGRVMPDLMSPLRVRRRRRDTVILTVDELPDGDERLPGTPHGHHVTRDAQAHRSRGGVAGEGERAVLVEGLDVAVTIALVPEPRASAGAGDVLQLVAMVDGIGIEPANVGQVRAGEIRELTFRQPLDLIADGVRRHRSASRSLGRRQCRAHDSRRIQEHSSVHALPPPIAMTDIRLDPRRR